VGPAAEVVNNLKQHMFSYEHICRARIIVQYSSQLKNNCSAFLSLVFFKKKGIMTVHVAARHALHSFLVCSIAAVIRLILIATSRCRPPVDFHWKKIGEKPYAPLLKERGERGISQKGR
jgi:hypothetical protein